MRCLLRHLLIVMALCATPVRATVGVELDAPEDIRGLLAQHVRLLRMKADEIPDAGPDRTALTRRARREVAELLATEGYFSARIRIDRSDPEHWKLVVEPGARASIVAVSILFEGEFGEDDDEESRREQLRKAWGLPVGEPFRQENWDSAKHALIDALTSRGYAAAKFSSSLADVDAERGEVKLKLIVDSGPVFRLGELEVSGLRDLPVDFVTRHSPLQVGDIYDRQALLAFQTTLQSAPQLATVVVSIDPDPSRAAAVPVRVQVREARRYRLGFGVGVSSNTGARVEANYRDINLFGRGWDLSSGLRLEQRRQAIFTDLFLPLNQRRRDGIGMSIDHSDFEGLKIMSQAMGVNRTMERDNGEIQLTARFQREEIHPDKAERSRYDTLTLNGIRVWRDVDDVLDPRRGHVLEIQLGGGLGLSPQGQNFVRAYGRYQHYFTVDARDVFSVRGELGATLAKSRDGVPQDFLFRAGGTQSVRGFAYKSLGVTEGAATVGGRYLATINVEYVHWFRPEAGLALFIDSGDAADSRASFKAHTGYGFGARWKSPAGPLALDLAWGNGESVPRLHFGVAIAF
ncbi:MAG: BamA/TamA family outer membrane protein [Azoarcus sp.]|nr:BamA/TamA family outer membrane protein [Azoarcus sp.]